MTTQPLGSSPPHRTTAVLSGTIRRPSPLLSVFSLALLMTLFNAVKPLHIDDTAYYYFARQIASHPLDPYGFSLLWYQHPDPANTVLAPPLLLYWLSLPLRLFGERPFLWKLWLFPFVLLFAGSLHLLFRRFARGVETPLLWMTCLSPTFLPSLNLMLDIPALSLSLGSLVLFLRACDRDSFVLALSAGLAAALGMQTKYTAFLAPVAMLLFSLATAFLRPGRMPLSVLRKLGLWLVAAGVAASLFALWEWWIARHYAEGSHFLFHLRDSQEPLVDKLGKVLPIFAVLGGVAPAVALLGLAALGRRRLTVLAACGVVIVGYVLVGCIDATLTLWLKLSQPLTWSSDLVALSDEQVIFTLFGAVGAVILLVIACRLLRVRRGGLWRPGRWSRHRLDWFLVMWLGLEVAGYLAMTPFVAVRRVMGVVIVGTLLAGRLASLACRPPDRGLLVRGVAIGNVLLGLLFYGVDLREAWVRKEAVETAVARIRERDPQPTIWYVGHWGFQYYAERAGMEPVDTGQSLLRKGDWLVVPNHYIHHQDIHIDPEEVQLDPASFSLTDALPFRTVWDMYGTGTGVPMEHREGSRLQIYIYHVTRDFVARQ